MTQRIWLQVGGAICLAILSYGAGRSAVAAPPAAQPRQALAALAAQRIGVRQCLSAISVVAQRGTSGATVQDILINWDHQKPNEAPFFSLTAMGSGAQRAALSVTAVPLSSSNCAILVERVSSGTDDCTTVAARELPGLIKGQLIDGVTVLQNPSKPDETYTLLQNPGTCTVIRRQAVFQWPPQR